MLDRFRHEAEIDPLRSKGENHGSHDRLRERPKRGCLVGAEIVEGLDVPLRRQHEQLLVEWGRSSLHLLRGSVAATIVGGATLYVNDAVVARG